MTQIITANRYVYIGHDLNTAYLIGQTPSVRTAIQAFMDYADAMFNRAVDPSIEDPEDRKLGAADLLANLCGWESWDVIPNIAWQEQKLSSDSVAAYIFLKTPRDPFATLRNIIEASYAELQDVISAETPKSV